MLVTLADLAQIAQSNASATPPGAWELKVQALQPSMTASDWSTLAQLAGALAQSARSTNAVPVATAASSLQTTTRALPAGQSSADANAAMSALMEAALLEDSATDEDRNFSGSLIAQQIGQLNTDIGTRNAKNTGFYAVWEQVKGVDVSAITAETQEIQDAINTTPLTVLGRRELQSQLSRAASNLDTTLSWSTIALGLGTTVGAAVAVWGVGKLQALAAAHAQKLAAKSRWAEHLGYGKPAKE